MPQHPSTGLATPRVNSARSRLNAVAGRQTVENGGVMTGVDVLVEVPLTGGGTVLAGPGTGVPAPPPPPAPVAATVPGAVEPTPQAVAPQPAVAQMGPPKAGDRIVWPAHPPTAAPVQARGSVEMNADPDERPPARRQREAKSKRQHAVDGWWAGVGERYDEAPKGGKVGLWVTVGGLILLGTLKWVVPWVTPDPDVVTVLTPPQTTAQTAPAAVTPTPVQGGSSALSWGPANVSVQARAFIGVRDGELDQERAYDVSRQAQRQLHDNQDAGSCDLRINVPAPGRLEVIFEKVDGSAPLFDCAALATTTIAPAAPSTTIAVPAPIAPSTGG